MAQAVSRNSNHETLNRSKQYGVLVEKLGVSNKFDVPCSKKHLKTIKTREQKDQHT